MVGGGGRESLKSLHQFVNLAVSDGLVLVVLTKYCCPVHLVTGCPARKMVKQSADTISNKKGEKSELMRS